MSAENAKADTSYYDHSIYKRLVIRPLAQRLAPVLYDLGLSANEVGWLKLFAGLVGAGLLASKDALLFVEGGSHPADVRAFLEARQVNARPRPALRRTDSTPRSFLVARLVSSRFSNVGVNPNLHLWG